MAKEMPKTARTGRDNQRKLQALPSHAAGASKSQTPNIRGATEPSLLQEMGQQKANRTTGYSESGERLVAGVVALSASKDQVLLIQSTRRGGWVLPKGGWELDEATAQDAAKREAWEEAGIITTITRDLGAIADSRKPQEMTGHAPKAKYQFFEARVDKEEAEWPEKSKRGRKWMKYAEAKDALKDRPELSEAIERSSVKR